MLRALRASVKGTQDNTRLVAKQQKPRLNSALTLRQTSEESPSASPTKSSTSPFAVEFPYRLPSVEENNNDVRYPPVVNSPGARGTDIKSGLASVRGKLDALKESIQKVNERQKQLDESLPQAHKRFVDAMDAIGDIQRRIVDKEEKLWKLEGQVKMREGKVSERHRFVEENEYLKRKIEREKLENSKDVQEMRQSMVEYAVRQKTALRNSQEASRQVNKLQAAIQKAEGRGNRATRRAWSLEGTIDNCKKRIRDIQFQSNHKVERVDYQHFKLNDLEDAIAECEQRYMVAEKRALPLGIYKNQVEEALHRDLHQVREARYLLANYQQRFKHFNYNNYYNNN